MKQEKPQNVTSTPSEYMTLEETAAFCRKSKSWAYQNWPKWAKSGVKARRLGSLLLFKESEVRNMIELNKIN